MALDLRRWTRVAEEGAKEHTSLGESA